MLLFFGIFCTICVFLAFYVVLLLIRFVGIYALFRVKFFLLKPCWCRLHFNKNKILPPGLENNHTLKSCSGNFSTLSYVRFHPGQELTAIELESFWFA